MRRTCISVLCVFSASLFAAPSLSAQTTTEPDTSKVRVRLGPVALNPTVELTNLGVDNNVFNQPDGQAKRDFTLTVSPKTDAWMKVGRTWLTGHVREDLVWYQRYSSERSANSSFTLGWTVPLNRLAFGVAVTYLNTRERPGFEIDARSRRTDRAFKGIAEYRALAKTFLGVKADRQRIDFDRDAFFLDSSLQLELNRTATNVVATVRHQLTPLTAITFDVGKSYDRFEFNALRDSDSTIFGAQVQFDPFALIKGSARIGYRNFVPADPNLPGYRGSTAAVDLVYTILGATRLGINVGRDIQYSYNIDQPYYLQTGVTGSIAQQVYGPVDVVFRGGLQHLNYSDHLVPGVAQTHRTDKVRLIGAGVGYHLGRDLRIGVNVDRQQRVTDLTQLRFTNLRIGTSVTYGL